MELSSISLAHILYPVLLSSFLAITNGFALSQPLCHSEEMSALLQFKQKFVFDDRSNSTSPKLSSWKDEGGNGNCCSWDGVECDRDSGYVIGLDLSDDYLHGSIDSNSSLFDLVHLRTLNLANNNFKNSEIPTSIGRLSELRYLNLAACAFSGQIPYTVSKLYKLEVLDLSHNTDNISGRSLLKLENPDLSTLISNLTTLVRLRLSRVYIPSGLPHFLANFSSLEVLVMNNCGLQGKFPEEVLQLQNLRIVDVGSNPGLYGHLPEFNYGNLLKELWLQETGFNGTLPFSIGNLVSLTVMHVSRCNFSGSIPYSLGNLTELGRLDLYGNRFSGQIPKSLGNLTNLYYLELSYNDFNEINDLSWLGKQSKLSFLILSSTNLRGDHLLSSLGNLRNLKWLIVSENHLVGQIPSSIRNMSSLMVFNIDSNDMTGMLPEWLGNFSNSLEFLSLKNNMFEGSIPNTFGNNAYLRLIDLCNNQLQGQVPRSLSKCQMLETIALANNRLRDVFPSWLGTLPNLKILILKSNKFHGPIGEPKTDSEFALLHIIDLSCNNFSSNLPFKYISRWNAMKNFSSPSPYMNVLRSRAGEDLLYNYCFYAIKITIKGSDQNLPRVQEVFTYIDLSCNRFEGEIQSVIGNLGGLQYLNLSHNMLTGQIPSSLGNMRDLESLDLSQNNLSGSIPPQLSKLTYLAVLNVSYNNLSGPIPQANQIITRDNSSFEGNPGLCGMPLSKICDNFKDRQVPSSTSEQYDELKSIWKTVLIGYGCGVVFGMVLGNYIFSWKQQWYLKFFRITPRRKRGVRDRN